MDSCNIGSHTHQKLIEFIEVLFLSIKLPTIDETWERVVQVHWTTDILLVVTALKEGVHVRVVCFHTVSIPEISVKVKGLLQPLTHPLIVRMLYALADFTMLNTVNLSGFVTLTLRHSVTPC